MIRGSLSLPPQMVNGGSPPTHLPSLVGSPLFPSSEGFPDAAKWMQPPARAPEWNGGGSLSDLAVLARRSEQEVIGLLEASAKNAQAILELRQKLAGCVALKNTVDDEAAAARTTALADATVEQRIREALDNERRRHEADVRRLRASLINERRRREANNSSANLALVVRRRLTEERRHHEAAAQATASATLALAAERCRKEASTRAAASAERALAEERSRHDASARAAALAELALAEERSRHDASGRAAALAELALAKERSRHNTAAQADESDALALAEEGRHHEAAAQATSLADSALAVERLCIQPAAYRSLVKAGHHDAATDCDVASSASPDRVPVAIRRIQEAYDILAAPLDALLAEFAALAVDPAPPTKTSSVPTATLPPSPRPRTYLDAVVGPSERGYTLLAPPSPSATPSPPSASAPTTPTGRTSHRAKPRRRTGRRNGPRAPSPTDDDKPSHPTYMMGGSLAMARAAPPCRSYTPSLQPSYTPSLQPFIFNDGALLYPRGGNAHPFHTQGLPLPPWKRTRRKYRPHRTCRRHQPRAPNQSTGWA
jgi:hypothetical protein